MQEAGEVIYVPQGWWHAVLNVSPWTVAVTHNLVPPAALPAAFSTMAGRDPLFARHWLRCLAAFGPGSDADRAAAVRLLRERCPAAVEAAMRAALPKDQDAAGAKEGPWAGIAGLGEC